MRDETKWGIIFYAYFYFYFPPYSYVLNFPPNDIVVATLPFIGSINKATVWALVLMSQSLTTSLLWEHLKGRLLRCHGVHIKPWLQPYPEGENVLKFDSEMKNGM